MPKINLTISVLLFCILSITPSFANWDWLSENMFGDTYSVDFDRIKKRDEFVYFKRLDDYLKQTETGDWSAIINIQADCILFRQKLLNGTFFKKPMGKGPGDIISPKNPEWIYPTQNSPNEIILKEVCEYAKIFN